MLLILTQNSRASCVDRASGVETWSILKVEQQGLYRAGPELSVQKRSPEVRSTSVFSPARAELPDRRRLDGRWHDKRGMINRGMINPGMINPGLINPGMISRPAAWNLPHRAGSAGVVIGAGSQAGLQRAGAHVECCAARPLFPGTTIRDRRTLFPRDGCRYHTRGAIVSESPGHRSAA